MSQKEKTLLLNTENLEMSCDESLFLRKPSFQNQKYKPQLVYSHKPAAVGKTKSRLNANNQ